MYIERGVLVAESVSENPEAVERTLEDQSVDILFTPGMASTEASARLYDLRRNPLGDIATATTVHDLLMDEVPIMTDVNQAVSDWVKRNRRLKLFYPAVSGPEYVEPKDSISDPHVDDYIIDADWRRGPLTISWCTAGERIFSGQRLGFNALNSIGLLSIVNYRRKAKIVASHKAAWEADLDYELRANAVQKTGDGVWIPGFPNFSVHLVKVEGYLAKVINNQLNSHAVIFDYKLWHDPSKVMDKHDMPIGINEQQVA